MECEVFSSPGQQQHGLRLRLHHKPHHIWVASAVVMAVGIIAMALIQSVDVLHVHPVLPYAVGLPLAIFALVILLKKGAWEEIQVTTSNRIKLYRVQVIPCRRSLELHGPSSAVVGVKMATHATLEGELVYRLELHVADDSTDEDGDVMLSVPKMVGDSQPLARESIMVPLTSEYLPGLQKCLRALVELRRAIGLPLEDPDDPTGIIEYRNFDI